jgi:putative transposase
MEITRSGHGKKYLIAIKSWNQNSDNLTTYFKYSYEVKKLIYTTNP